MSAAKRAEGIAHLASSQNQHHGSSLVTACCAREDLETVGLLSQTWNEIKIAIVVVKLASTLTRWLAVTKSS